MDRRTTLKWMLAASASMPLTGHPARADAPGADAPGADAPGADAPGADVPGAAVAGYGTDPDLVKVYHPGDVWPLSFTAAQRRTAGALCDVIVPADEQSPSASAVGVVDFLDEWVSAPYPHQLEDRPLILDGLQWLDAEALRRGLKVFADLDAARQHAICDDICHEADVMPAFVRAASFFARFRDLTAGGYYSTPAGSKDLGYVGNVPQLKFVGAAPETLRKLGLVGGNA